MIRRTHYLMVIVVAIACAAALTGCSSSDGARDVLLNTFYQERNRLVQLHIPEGVGQDGPVPLVIAFHGAGSTGRQFQQGAGLDAQAAAGGFVVAYPSATGVNWAEGCGCIRPDLDGVDDIGFVDMIPDLVSEEVSVDRDRIYAVGYSQGGIFMQRLACERSHMFAGFAGVAGTMSEPVHDVCEPVAPVSMLTIHGSGDTVVPFFGSTTGSSSLLSAPATIGFWRDHNQCTGDADRTSGVDGLDIRRYDTCEAGTRVHFVEVIDGGHAWPRSSPDAPRLITEFFRLR